MKKTIARPEIAGDNSHHTPQQMAHIREVVKGLPAEFRNLATTIGMFATSGLNSHYVMRTLPNLLRRLVPIDIAGYFWANAEGDMIDAFVETPHFLRAEVVLSCLRFQQETKGNWPSFQENVLAGPCVGYLQSYQTDAFYQSEHYKLVYAPINIQHIIDVVVHDGSKPYGAFLLMRNGQSTPFTALEMQFLRAITDLLVYAHSVPAAKNVHATRSYDAGIRNVGALRTAGNCIL